MAGTKEIAEILRQKEDPEKYKSIIQRAELYGYHDHKFDKIPGHAEYGMAACPKVQLVKDLSVFPELNDIRQDVIDGKYDEPPDDEDNEEMRGWLIDDNAPDKMFEILGFKAPTQEERDLRLNQKENN